MEQACKHEKRECDCTHLPGKGWKHSACELSRQVGGTAIADLHDLLMLLWSSVSHAWVLEEALDLFTKLQDGASSASC